MKRILCIQLPNWPVQRLRAVRPELDGRPLILSRQVRGVERVFACSHEAAALGVVRRQPIAEVKGLAADGRLTVLPHDPDADRAALLQWAEHCARFSPLVGADDAPEPDSLLLDITATARLFGGETALAGEVVAAFARRRLRVRAAVADTSAGAWAVAHFHGAFFIQRSPLLQIPPGETPGALRLLPIESLRLPERTLTLLHELGVDLVGQLALLPRDDLPSRFGPELLRCWDRATGVQPEPICAVWLRSEFTASWEAEVPTRRRETVHAALEQVVERLGHDLRAAGRGATRIECRFYCLPGERHGDRAAVRPGGDDFSSKSQAEDMAPSSSRALVRFVISLFRPTGDVKHLLGLLHLKLEKEQLAGPVAGVEVAALETGPLVQRQLSLFTRDAADDNGQPSRHGLEQLIERLSNRLGRQAVLAVCLLPDAQPERAWRGESLVGGPRRKRAGKPFAGELPFRPLTLFSRPLALRAAPSLHLRSHEDEAISPARIHFDGEEHCLTESWGPERIETGWWRGRQIARDYHRVETAAGRCLWLFRRLDNGRWFAHGTFD